MSSCRFVNACSPFLHIKSGVPQGSVISPALFNFFISDYPATANLITSYADDFTAATSSPNVEQAALSLSAHANDVVQWAANKKLTIAYDKTHPTLFTSDTHQSRMDPGVSVNNRPLELERNPKILGVHFDPHLRFSHHAQQQSIKASSRLRIMKALAGTNWGQQKETLILTYRALIKSVIQYAAPVWFPNASNTAVMKLQTIQNSAIRIATGCIRMSPINHLHSEAALLPVKDSLSLLCKQYLASALTTTHPSYPTVSSDSGPRSIRSTLTVPLPPFSAAASH